MGRRRADFCALFALGPEGKELVCVKVKTALATSGALLRNDAAAATRSSRQTKVSRTRRVWRRRIISARWQPTAEHSSAQVAASAPLARGGAKDCYALQTENSAWRPVRTIASGPHIKLAADTVQCAGGRRKQRREVCQVKISIIKPSRARHPNERSRARRSRSNAPAPVESTLR